MERGEHRDFVLKYVGMILLRDVCCIQIKNCMVLLKCCNAFLPIFYALYDKMARQCDKRIKKKLHTFLLQRPDA